MIRTSTFALLLVTFLSLVPNSRVAAQNCSGCANESLDATTPLPDLWAVGNDEPVFLSISFGGASGTCGENTWGCCEMVTGCTIKAEFKVVVSFAQPQFWQAVSCEFSGSGCDGSQYKGSDLFTNSKPNTAIWYPILETEMPLDCGETCLFQFQLTFKYGVTLPTGVHDWWETFDIYSNLFLICTECSDVKCDS